MTMTKVCVQQQTGGSDCGVFAIAFAVALAHGQDPATLRNIRPKSYEETPQTLPESKEDGSFPYNKEAEVQEKQSDREGVRKCRLCLQGNLGGWRR